MMYLRSVGSYLKPFAEPWTTRAADQGSGLQVRSVSALRCPSYAIALYTHFIGISVL